MGNWKIENNSFKAMVMPKEKLEMCMMLFTEAIMERPSGEVKFKHATVDDFPVVVRWIKLVI